MGIFRRGSDTASDTDLLTRPELEEDDGGHDRFSHYVKKEKRPCRYPNNQELHQREHPKSIDHIYF